MILAIWLVKVIVKTVPHSLITELLSYRDQSRLSHDETLDLWRLFSFVYIVLLNEFIWFIRTYASRLMHVTQGPVTLTGSLCHDVIMMLYLYSTTYVFCKHQIQRHYQSTWFLRDIFCPLSSGLLKDAVAIVCWQWCNHGGYLEYMGKSNKHQVKSQWHKDNVHIYIYFLYWGWLTNLSPRTIILNRTNKCSGTSWRNIWFWWCYNSIFLL